jgi:O-antigen/teichoic acid export membrane protein
MINLVGSIIPVVIAVPCFAIMARTLSPAQFSLVLLAWAMVGYAGILDLGLSRAVVTVIAEVRSDPNMRREVISTALLVVTIVSVIGAIVLSALSDTIVLKLIKVAPNLVDEAVHGFRIVALTIPFLLFYLIVQGYWDGMEEFIEANYQRTISGSLPLFLATLGILLHKSFYTAMIGVLIGRVMVFALILFRKNFHQMLSFNDVSRPIIRRLISFGGWVTLSNSISPIMGYLDRYILAYARSGQIVSFYAAPSEVVLKMLVAPQAITRSMYPKLIAADTEANRQKILISSYKLILLICLPTTAIIMLFAPILLKLWLGPVYAAESALALRVLAVGFLACSIAQVPFCHIQARGKPKITAAIHLAEVLPFIAGAYLLAREFGVPGIAIAWSVRCVVDMLILSYFSRQLK